MRVLATFGVCNAAVAQGAWLEAKQHRHDPGNELWQHVLGTEAAQNLQAAVTATLHCHALAREARFDY